MESKVITTHEAPASTLKSTIKVIGYILVSVLISEAFLAALSAWFDVKLPSETAYLVNVFLVALAKEVKRHLPENSKIGRIL